MKPISSENYLIRPFLTHKTQTYGFTYLGTNNPDQVAVDLAIMPPDYSAWRFYEDQEQINADGTLSRPLYASIKNMFYSSESVYARGNFFNPTGSQFYVISMAQQSYGEGIKPGSFVLTGAASTASLHDDGIGHIIGANGIVGNIFYGLGIAVIQQVTNALSSSIVTDIGMYMTTGSQVTVEFDASYTIYEHQIICTVDEGELNYSTNPSIKARSAVLGDPHGKVFDSFATGTLTPYMTTVGAYTAKGELVAIGKFPRPIKRATESQQTIIIRFDI